MCCAACCASALFAWRSPPFASLVRCIRDVSEKCPPGGRQSEVPCAQADRVFLPYGKWGNTITVTTNGSASTSSNLAFVVGVGFDSNSVATLVWEQLTGGGSCALEAVTGTSASGFGTPQVLGNTCLGWVQLAVTSSGQALVVQGGATLEVAPIIATSRGANGVWAAPIQVARPYYGRQRPWVGLGNNGTAAVVWRARTFGEYAIRENGVWTAPAELPQGTGSIYPRVAVDGNGNAVAAYSGKVTYRPAGGTFQSPLTLGTGGVVASPGGTFMLSGSTTGTPIATLLPGTTTWNQNGPASGAVAIGPGEAIALPNPQISVSTAMVP